MPASRTEKGWGDTQKSIRRFFALLFVVLTGIPLVLLIIVPVVQVAETEKRELAAFPEKPAGIAAIPPYPKRFEAWFNDHFGLRTALIHGHSRVKVSLLGVSTHQKVALGNNGWLYYSGDVMDDFRGVRRLGHEGLVYWQRFLEGKRDWLAARGVRYLFVVAPNKQSIYPEFIPARHTRVGTPMLDQLLAHLKRNSDLEILDLRPALAAAKQTGRLYDKTDSHWNERGAYIAYQAMMERLTAWFPALAATPLTRFRVETDTASGGNLAGMLNLKDVLLEDRTRLTLTVPACAERTAIQLAAKRPWARHARPFRIRCDTASDVGAVIFRDSFFSRLTPLLSESLRQADYVWQANAKHPLTESFPLMMQMVARERPDVVIDEIVERKLIHPIALHPPLLAATARKRFRESDTVLLTAGSAGLPLPVRPVNQATVTPEAGGIRIRTTGPEGLVALPAIEVPDGHWPVVRLRLDSPVQTVMKLLYQTTSVPRYVPEQSVLVPVTAGANDLYFELPEVGITGPLWLHPGPAPGSFTVREIEVRTRLAPVPVPDRAAAGPEGASG